MLQKKEVKTKMANAKNYGLVALLGLGLIGCQARHLTRDELRKEQYSNDQFISEYAENQSRLVAPGSYREMRAVENVSYLKDKDGKVIQYATLGEALNAIETEKNRVAKNDRIGGYILATAADGAKVYLLTIAANAAFGGSGSEGGAAGGTRGAGAGSGEGGVVTR
jgi:hypothetical protein